jgi:hypothetical protein
MGPICKVQGVKEECLPFLLIELLILEYGPDRFPEMPVIKYQSTLCNIPEEQTSQDVQHISGALVFTIPFMFKCDIVYTLE